MAEMSIREYARHRGVTHEAVRKAIRTGRVQVLRQEGNRSIIDSVVADRQWDSATDPSQQRAQRTESNESARAFAGARAVREQYEARLARLTFEEKSGKLVVADEVKVSAFNAARNARDALLNIPDRVAPLITGMTDTREIHRIISEEVRRVCELISGERAAT